MTVKFEVDYMELRELERKMAQLPGATENLINDTLHDEGAAMVIEEITKLIPVSRWRNSIRNKKHAKQTDWSKSETFNLGFTVKTKGGAAKNPGSLGYLVFPNEGRGPSNPIEQRFAEQGLKKAKPRILEALNHKLDKRLKEELS